MTAYQSTADRVLRFIFVAMAVVVAFPLATASAFSEEAPKKASAGMTAAQPGASQGSAADAIRPFHVNVPEEHSSIYADASPRRAGPTAETVTDRSQGVQLAAMQGTRALLGNGLRLAEGRGEAQRTCHNS